MRQFADVLRELCAGSTYDELTARLGEVVEAVTDTGKVGEISIKLKIKPNGDAGVIVTDEIKTKVPERARGDTVFFVTSGGSLVRQDPRQQDLPLRSVPGTVPEQDVA
jgi:ribosomal protein S28E/S33